jgi:hypothetical protein
MSIRSPNTLEKPAETRWPDQVTAYDESNLFVYARLLDAKAAGMRDVDMIEQILNMEAGTDEAQTTLIEYLDRARWMRDVGYRMMLSDSV